MYLFAIAWAHMALFSLSIAANLGKPVLASKLPATPTDPDYSVSFRWDLLSLLPGDEHLWGSPRVSADPFTGSIQHATVAKAGEVVHLQVSSTAHIDFSTRSEPLVAANQGLKSSSVSLTLTNLDSKSVETDTLQDNQRPSEFEKHTINLTPASLPDHELDPSTEPFEVSGRSASLEISGNDNSESASRLESSADDNIRSARNSSPLQEYERLTAIMVTFIKDLRTKVFVSNGYKVPSSEAYSSSALDALERFNVGLQAGIEVWSNPANSSSKLRAEILARSNAEQESQPEPKLNKELALAFLKSARLTYDEARELNEELLARASEEDSAGMGPQSAVTKRVWDTSTPRSLPAGS